MGSLDLPPAWHDPRPWLLMHFEKTPCGFFSEWAVRRILLKNHTDVASSTFATLIRNSPYSAGPLLAELKWIDACPQALAVRYAVNALSAFMNSGEFDVQPIHIQQKVGKCLDMYWPLVSDLEKATDGAAFDKAWYRRYGEQGRYVPSPDNLDQTGSYVLQHAFLSIVSSHSAASLPQDEHAPLAELFRKAWPQRHRLEAFCKRFADIIGVTAKRRVRVSENVTESEMRVHATGHQVLGLFMQWWCLFHIGAYRHSAFVVRSAAERKKNCALWCSINEVVANDYDRGCFTGNELFEQPIVSLCVIKEFIVHCVRNDFSLQHYIGENAKWKLFERMTIEFCDNYRRSLPYQPGPVAVFKASLATFERRRKHMRKVEKQLRREKREARVKKDIERKKRKKAGSAGGEDDHTEELIDSLNLSKSLSAVKKNVVLVEELENDAKMRDYNEDDDYEEKTERLDEELIREMNRLNQNPALTQLYVFVRCVHDVGSSTRMPDSMWAYLAKNMPVEPVACFDLDKRIITFAPAIQTLSARAERLRGRELDFDKVRSHFMRELDAQWMLGVDTRPIQGLGEETSLPHVDPPLHAAFLMMRRFVHILMTVYHCHEVAQGLMTNLIHLYYQNSRCGKPTVLTSIHEMIKRFPYEYAILSTMVSAWKEKQRIRRIPVSVTAYENQVLQASAYFGNYAPVDERFDWLVYCPVCSVVRSTIDQCTPTGNAFPVHHAGKHVAGLGEVYVDIIARVEDESDRPLYWPRKTGVTATACSHTQLCHAKLMGYVVFFNGKAYTMCSNCPNRMECFTEYDSFNRKGFMCATCVFEQEFRDTCDREHEEAKRLYAAFRTPFRTRKLKLSNDEEVHAVVDRDAVIPGSRRRGTGRATFFDELGNEITGRENIAAHRKKIKEEEEEKAAKMMEDDDSAVYGDPTSKWVPAHLKRNAANFESKRPRGRPKNPQIKFTSDATAGDETLNRGGGGKLQNLGELNAMMARTKKYLK